jgi:hypothetical protein
LPWIAALTPLREHRRAGAALAARRTLEHTVLLALSAFPHAILPNPLVRELGALAGQADVPMPLVEEVAADIFMGTFTTKWRSAAAVASRTLVGTLYARYYDLPPDWAQVTERRRRRWGRQTADDFAELCRKRARVAKPGGRHSWVAENGTVLEQSQILTTHNLAVLVDGLGLGDRLATLAPDLADRALTWAVRRLAVPARHHHAALVAIKNSTYAWRQAVFFLSYCDQATQEAAVDRLRDLAGAGQLGPAIDGLAAVVAGDPLTAAGRRFLGWSAGPHWLLDHLRL